MQNQPDGTHQADFICTYQTFLLQIALWYVILKSVNKY